MVVNFYNIVKKEAKTINPNYDTHKIKIPFRMCVSGHSGTCKTLSILNLIYLMNKSFHEIIYCIKTADEPLVNHLEEKTNTRIYENGEVPPLSDFCYTDPQTNRVKSNDKLQRLIIFDDLMLETKAIEKIKEYYIKGRKICGGISCIFISQSYFRINKLIRDNSSYFILTKNLLKKDLKMIISLFPARISLEEFYSMYEELTKGDINFVLIDIEKRRIAQNINGREYSL